MYLGSVWLYNSNLQQCDRPFVIGVGVTVAGGWLMLLILIVGIIANFDPTGTVHHGDVKLTDETRKVAIKIQKFSEFTGKKSINVDVAKSIETGLSVLQQQRQGQDGV